MGFDLGQLGYDHVDAAVACFMVAIGHLCRLFAPMSSCFGASAGSWLTNRIFVGLLL